MFRILFIGFILALLFHNLSAQEVYLKDDFLQTTAKASDFRKRIFENPDTSILNQTNILTSNALNCSNWLKVPARGSFVKVGDLDVSGDQITVEATINRTAPWTGGPLYAGDIVSKHTAPTDINYLLRPNHAEITTTNGYFKTPDICEIELNKTYHVAMVYNGSVLKFYRNGFLMSQVIATGNLFQNDFETRIGYYFLELYNESFIGYINEVRIWKVARTQSELRSYMNTSLPSPTTQPGLLAYYTFEDLLNKQGNPSWNGQIVASATINEFNPTCSAYAADSCCPILDGNLVGSTICAGDVANLTFNSLNGQGPFVLALSNGTNTIVQTGVMSGVPFALTTPLTSTTTYQLISIADPNGCGSSSGTLVGSAVVTVKPISIAADSVHASSNNICSGTTVQLSAIGGSLTNGSAWRWYESGCAGATIGSGQAISVSPQQTTMYFVRAEGGCNTTACVSLSIKVNPKPNIQFDPLNDVCLDKAEFKFSNVREVSGLRGIGTLSGDGVSAAGVFSPALAGVGAHNIRYTFVSDEGCTDSKTQSINVNPIPIADAGNDVNICPGFPIQLKASGGITYEWSPSIGLDKTNIPNPTAIANTSITYHLLVTDSKGCTATDSIRINASSGNKETFRLPSAFTPNNDGKNDCFGIEKWGEVQVTNFSIFNRWGQKVFSTKNSGECWNGKVNGVDQDAGGYVYFINAMTSCGVITFKGVIMLVR